MFKRWHTGLLIVSLAFDLGACGKVNTESPVATPGREAKGRTKLLEAGAAVLQAKRPIDAIHVYLDGFHFYNGKQNIQMEAHHFCTVLNEDLIQCVIYDGNERNAKMMGIEYVISETLFATLPLPEKALWHSHVHEVKSGQLIAPGIPDIAEHQLMDKLMHTYGKTWHTWHTDLDKKLPLGVPQLMMGFTADGQVDPAMVATRDQRFDIQSDQKKAARQDLVAPKIDPGADGWTHGAVTQISDPTGNQHRHEESASKPQTVNESANANARSHESR